MPIETAGVSQVDKSFEREVKSFKEYIEKVKSDLDLFDEKNGSREERISNIEKLKIGLFEEIGKHFNKVWERVKQLDKNSYAKYRKYFQDRLLPFFGYPEINHHIYSKPLGYAGDFITMNYIYDFHDKHLGNSSFEILINMLTCNIPISRSNIKRREHLRQIIKDAYVKHGDEIKIASIASGSARELLGMLENKELPRSIDFVCFDFESKALEYVKENVSRIYGSDKSDNIKLIKSNIVDLARKPEIKNVLNGRDLIYAFGIYDYLSDMLAKRITKILFECLNPGGHLVVCNASASKSDQRAYYEFLGEWEMIYRTNEELVRFSDGLAARSISLKDDPDDCYIYLTISK